MMALKSEPMFKNEGLSSTMAALKRAYVNSNCCSLQRGTTYFKYGIYCEEP